MSEIRENISESEYGEELHWTIRVDIIEAIEKVARRVAAGERVISVEWVLEKGPDGDEDYTELVIKFAHPEPSIKEQLREALDDVAKGRVHPIDELWDEE